MPKSTTLIRILVYSLISLFTFSFISIFTPHIEAAKPRLAPARPATIKAKTVSIGYSSVRLSRPTNSLVITFTNLASVKKIDYILSYQAKNLDQGALGSVNPAGNASEKRDLYFGTCSHGACTPHLNIKNSTLTITSSLKNGQTSIKRYRIKV